jgi:hypothetical protein
MKPNDATNTAAAETIAATTGVKSYSIVTLIISYSLYYTYFRSSDNPPWFDFQAVVFRAVLGYSVLSYLRIV